MKQHTHGAQPTDRVSAAPCGPVWWYVNVRGVDVPSVRARSWYAAREIVMLLHRCEPSEAKCSMI